MEAQTIWDRLLLNLWFDDYYGRTSKAVKTSWVVSSFIRAYGQRPEDLGLKRIPRNYWQSHTAIGGFVALCLPRLNKILLDCEKKRDDIEDLVEKLSRWSIDTLDVRAAASKEDTAEQRKTKQEYRAAVIGMALVNEARVAGNEATAGARIRTRTHSLGAAQKRTKKRGE